MERRSKIGLSLFDWFVVLFTSIIYCILLSQYIGSVDDVMYGYQRIGGHIRWDKPINSLLDAIHSQSEDYFLRNGRVLVHTLVQCLCGLQWGRSVFFISSTFMYGALVIGLIKIIRFLNHGKCLSLVLIVVLFAMIPVPGQTFIGNISFTINYLWTSTMTVWMLYLFVNKQVLKKIENKHLIVFAILFALISGSMHEGFSLPMSGMFFIYVCFKPELRKFPVIYVIIAYWIGTLAVSLAPANFLRVTDTSYLVGFGQGFLKKGITIMLGLVKQEIIVVIFIFCLIVSLISYIYGRYRKFVVNLMPFFIVGFFALLFDIFVAYIGKHQLTPIALMTCVILVLTMSRAKPFEKSYFRYMCNGIMAIVIIVISILTYQTRRNLQNEWNMMHLQASEGGGDINGAKLLEITSKTSQFVLRMTSSKDAMLHIQDKHWFETLSYVIACKGKNPNLVKCVLPDTRSNIVKECKESNEIGQDVYRCHSYVIAKIPIVQVTAGKNEHTLNIIYKPGLIGTLLRRLGVNPSVFYYTAPKQAHQFSDSEFLYVPFFVDPDKIEYCELQ